MITWDRVEATPSQGETCADVIKASSPPENKRSSNNNALFTKLIRIYYIPASHLSLAGHLSFRVNDPVAVYIFRSAVYLSFALLPRYTPFAPPYFPFPLG